ncbi:4Fe-4S binding protein [bacterium]|nr:4Fe-4S binding protein [bacterium]
MNGDLCIGCGLCIVRCPYGAIYGGEDGRAVIEASDPDGLTVHRPSQCSHPQPTRVGRIASLQTESARNLPTSLSTLGDLERAQLMRNLFVATGIRCRTRRRGDTNIRMDGVIAMNNGRIGVLEIELTSSVLDSPRALLEDVAVLHGRYGIDVSAIDPVSVIMSLPNERSEYFQVIADIEKVLDIRCRTVTVGALIAVVWHLHALDGFTGTAFTTRPTGTDLLPGIREFVVPSISKVQPYDGAYRPSK